MRQLWSIFYILVFLDVNVLSPQPSLQKFTRSLPGQNHSEKGANTIMDKIFNLEDSAMEAWRQGNPMRWVDASADDVIYIDPGLNAPIVGKQAYTQYLEPLKGKIYYDKSEFVNPKVALYGKTAILTYNYHSLRKNPSGQFERTSFWNTTEVYRLIGDEWKIIHTHWSYIQHSLPESLELTIPVLTKIEKPFTGAADEILHLETAAMKRWRKGDPAGFLVLSAPEITYFDTGTAARLNGLDELKKEYAPLTGKINYDVMEFIQPQINVFDDSAVLFYQYFSTTLNPDGTIQSRTPWNCTEVYVKTPAGWKIVHTHWSYIKGVRKGGGI